MFGNVRAGANDTALLAFAVDGAAPPRGLLEVSMLGGGVYSVRHAFTRTGEYRLALMLGGAHLAGSPVTVRVGHAVSVPAMATMAWTCATAVCRAGLAVTANIPLRDAWGNAADVNPGAANALITRNSTGSAATDMQCSLERVAASAIFSCTFVPSLQGTYAMHVVLSDVPATFSPVAFTVVPDDVAVPERFSMGGGGIKDGVAGRPLHIAMAPHDRYGNWVRRGGQRFAASLSEWPPMRLAFTPVVVEDNGGGNFTATPNVTRAGEYRVTCFCSAAASPPPLASAPSASHPDQSPRRRARRRARGPWRGW